MSKVKFIQYHQPPMESGKYRIHMEQTISTAPGCVQGIPTAQTYTRELVVAVVGERYSALAPPDISAVFPPQDSLGDHSNVLPHISLHRSTLPWERSPDETDVGRPWLALLLFREFPDEDKPTPKVITVGELLSTTQKNPDVMFPTNVELEPGQQASDKVTVIDVRAGFLKRIIPTKSEVALMAHVRLQAKDDDGQITSPVKTTVICSRLPQPGGLSTVYLISVEDRYPHPDNDTSTDSANNFDFQLATDDQYIRLVCLASFSFSCLDEQQSFTNLLLNLDAGTLQLPQPPGTSNPAQSLVATGFVPLRHRMREGDTTVSWYHGPCRTGQTNDPLTLPVRSGDELMRYDQSTSMFDVSYAAAWEIGRMLTLQSQGVSVALYDWKRNQAQSLEQGGQVSGHLPLTPQSINTEIPHTVAAWFGDLALLENVPFNYLVPDDRLFTVESIRFFELDKLWMECLLDGAFSIGRVTVGDFKLDGRTFPKLKDKILKRNVTGFLLRSDVVSGWPDLLVEAYGGAPIDDVNAPPASDIPLAMLRMERLSSNVLLCLFNGNIHTVDIHQKPETLHYGVETPIGTPLQFHKQVRDLVSGEVLPAAPGSDQPMEVVVPFLNQDVDLGVVDIQTMASDFISSTNTNASDFTSAQFALEMVEGVQKVRFTVKTT